MRPDGASQSKVWSNQEPCLFFVFLNADNVILCWEFAADATSTDETRLGSVFEYLHLHLHVYERPTCTENAHTHTNAC